MKAITTFLILSVFIHLTIDGQTMESFTKRLNRIDSIVNSSNTYAALAEIGPFYNEFVKLDSTSSDFKKLAREYIFILAKSEVNDKAIDFSNLLLNRKLEDPKFNAELLILLARLQEKIGNGTLCKSRLVAAKKLLLKANSDSLEMVWNIRNASYHRIFENKDSAILFAQKGFDIAGRINQPMHQATASFLLAFLSNNVDFQIERLMFSKNNFKYNTDISGTAGMCLGLRRCYLKKGDSVKAQFYLDTIGTFIKTSPYLSTKLWYYKTVRNNFKAKGQLDSAIIYYDSVNVLSAKLQHKQDRIKLLTNDLVFANRRLTERISQKELIIQKEQHEKKLIAAFLAIALFLTAVIFLLSFNQYKKRKIIEHQKTLMRERNVELNTALERNRTLLMELNHRVKNNLSTLSGLLDIQISKSNNKLVTKELTSSINRINIISEVYKWALDNEELTFTSVKEIIENTVKSQFSLANESANLLQLDVDHISIKAANVMPLVMSINELVVNSFKHSDISKGVSVKVISQKDHIYCTVKDLGTGIPDDYKVSESNSTGLYIVTILVSQLKGKLEWSTEGGSFTIGFKFPKQ